jgi:hypothetical protein
MPTLFVCINISNTFATTVYFLKIRLATRIGVAVRHAGIRQNVRRTCKVDGATS